LKSFIDQERDDNYCTTIGMNMFIIVEQFHVTFQKVYLIYANKTQDPI